MGSPGSLPACPPNQILKVYHENSFHLREAATDLKQGVTTTQLVTSHGTEEPAAAYCLDHGIEDGSYLRLVALACLDPRLACRATGTSCLNLCCAEKSPLDCQLPQLLRRDFSARPKQLECADIVGANVTVTDKVREVFKISVPFCGGKKRNWQKIKNLLDLDFFMHLLILSFKNSSIWIQTRIFIELKDWATIHIKRVQI